MSLFRKLVSALKAGSVSKEDWEVIRQQLIATDLGVNLVDQVIEKSKSIKSDTLSISFQPKFTPG